MIQTSITALKDYILTWNTYFTNGYDDVYMDENTGIVANDKPVFPNDKIGDYFYIRLPQQTRFDYTAASTINDCSNTPMLDAELTLIACMRNASADILMTNLVNTISSYNDAVRFISARYNSEDVVLQELSRMKKEKVDAALSRLGNHTIISVTFRMLVNFKLRKVSADCILNPCVC